jgi:hypothetical protein
MRFRPALLLVVLALVPGLICRAQESPKPQDATTAVLRAFQTHDIVMIGEIHGNKQEYEWFRSLVSTPEFADRVDDIVLEMGNSLYQKSVDRYVSGEDVPPEQVQKAWRNTVGGIGPQSPVVAWFYQAVRETNMKRRGKHQVRILCGDPYIDWEKVQSMRDVSPYLSHRDDWYTQVVKDEVLAKHHRALLIMGSMHFLRSFKIGPMEPVVEPELRKAGASTYLILAGTNTVGAYDEVDHRFDAWPAMVIAPATGWLGELPARPLLSGGIEDLVFNMTDESDAPISAPPFTVPKLRDGADALLYLGPRDRLTSLSMTRAQLEGTPYGKEIERRLKIEGMPMDAISDREEEPQFPRPDADNAAVPLPPPPPPAAKAAPPAPGSAPAQPKKKGPVPLPPRPPPQ